MLHNVCFVSSFFPPSIGGVERYLLNLIEDLHRRGTNASIITRHYPGLSRYEKCLTHSIHRVGWALLPKSRFHRLNYLSKVVGDLLFSYTVIGYPLASSIVTKSEVVHSQLGDSNDIYLGSRLSTNSGLRHIITIHGKFGKSAEDISPRKKLIRTLGKADHLIVNRKSSLEFLSKYVSNEVSILENSIPVQTYIKPVEYSRLSSETTCSNILFIGRLSYRRGAHLAVQSFAQISQRHPNVFLSIVGAGDLENKLKSYVRRQGIANRVHFYGKKDDVRPFLWQSSIFLAPSPIANSPSLSLREAMAAGLAVVATDVEDTKEVVHHKITGLLAKPNPNGIADSIETLLTDDKLRKNLSNTAVNYALKHFDIKSYVNHLLKIYQA